MSSLDEIGQAVAHAVSAGCRDLALLHCVSCYPVPHGSENLRAIQTLAREFGLPVGLSDHGREPVAAAIVVALGGSIYEKHLVMADDEAAVDRAVSATPTDLAAIIATAERTRQSLGDGVKACLPAEQPNRVPSRRSLRAARDLPLDHVIGPDDIVALRPSDGLEPMHLAELIGTVLQRPLRRHDPFLAEDVQEALRQISHVD
jgi:sialic acid synthase SpsE